MSYAINIQQKINQSIPCQDIHVEDESYKHAGHAGYKGDTGTHFKVYIVSEAFSGLSKIARHRLINRVLADEFASHIHALSLTALSPDELS